MHFSIKYSGYVLHIANNLRRHKDTIYLQCGDHDNNKRDIHKTPPYLKEGNKKQIILICIHPIKVFIQSTMNRKYDFTGCPRKNTSNFKFKNSLIVVNRNMK